MSLLEAPDYESSSDEIESKVSIREQTNPRITDLDAILIVRIAEEAIVANPLEHSHRVQTILINTPWKQDIGLHAASPLAPI
jgi:hypothetical protein